MIDTTTLLKELSLVNYVSSLDLDTKGQILRYYNNIIKARTASDPEHDKFKQDIIDNNYTYSIILNKLFYMAIFSSVTATQLESDIYGIENLSGMIRNLRAIMEQKGSKGSVYEELYNHVLKGEDISIIDEVQAADIPKALSCYGVQSVDDDKPFEDIEIADEEDESKFDDFFDNDGPDDEYSDDSVSDELDNVKNSVIESIKNYVEASEAENIDKITFNVNNTGISESSDLKINVDTKDNHVCIDINVSITESRFEGDDYEKSINCESYASSSTIEALKIRGAEDEESVSKQIVEYIDKILNPVSVKETEDDFDSAIEKAEKQYQEELKNGDVSGKDIDINDFKEEEDDETKLIVDNLVEQIIAVYEEIYRPLFNTPPVGVLFTNESGQRSIMAVGNSETNTGVRVHELKSIRIINGYIYDAILNQISELREAPKVGDDGMNVDASWLNIDGSMKYNYMPHIQVRNCMRVYRDKETGKLKRAKNWNEFRDKFKSDIKPTIHKFLSHIDINNEGILKKAISSILSLYTTIILVNEFDPKKNLRLTIFNTESSISNKTEGIANAIVQKNPFMAPSLSNYHIMNNEETNGVRSILIVTDIKRYKGELMFAYKLFSKLVENGGYFNLKNTIVGTTLKGDTYTVNLADTANTIIGVIAGSGSGKGVLTLALVASMIGSRAPVVYVDYKPDMAKSLWELQNNNGGRGILAVDGAGGSISTDLEPGWGMDGKLKGLTVGLRNTIPYVKAIQLMNILGQYRITHYQKIKAFFILDEAQKAGAEITDVTNKLTDIIKKELKLTKTSTEEERELNKKANRLLKLYEETGNNIDTFMKTNGRSGNMSAVVLGQSPEATGWPRIFYNIISSCPLRFLGSGTYNPNSQTKAGMAKDVDGAELLGRGYFGVCKGTTSSKDNTTVIKTAMILNDADFDVASGNGGTYTGSLLSNIEDPNIKEMVINEDLTVNQLNAVAASKVGANIGDANPLVGFPGIMKYIGNSIGNDEYPFDLDVAMELGKVELEHLLEELGIIGEGRFSSVETYLYSAREDSIFTTGELSEALKKNLNIYDYLSSGGEETDLNEPIMGNTARQTESDIIGFTGGSVNNSGGLSSKCPQGLVSISMLVKCTDEAQSEYDKKWYRAFKNEVLRRNKISFNNDANKYSLDKSIKVIDNFHYLANKFHHGDVEEVTQTLLNLNKQDSSAIVANILQLTTNAKRDYDSIPSKEMLQGMISTGTGGTQQYTANRQTMRLSPEMQQSITQEVIAIAKEMKDAGIFDGLSNAEIREMIANVIQEVKAEILSGGN